ncbi:MAG: DNA polymerase III subunit beta, partial [Lachnospiraceae bacterium]
KHIVFEFDKTVVVSRLIEGEYFKIDQMLSSDYETKVRVNKKEFLSCIDRANDEEVDLYMVNPKAPCFIKNAKESYMYLILP